MDDAHWADPPTLRFLLYLVPRLEGLPVLVQIGARPGEPGTASELLDRLVTDPAARVLRPSPLSRDGVGALAATQLGEPAAETFADACHESTAGNPFLLHELLAALMADRVRPDAAAVERIRGLGPETVSRSLLLRLARLPEACGELARAVAVLGARAELAVAAALAEVPLDAAGEAADALAAIEILSPDRPLAFAHPVVREAIYADLPASERSAMHAAAARVLAAAGAAPETLATHLLATEPAANAAVVEALRAAAATALAKGAADLAQRYLKRALAEPPGAGERPAVLDELGTAQWLAAEEPLEAIEHLRESVRLTADPTERAGRALVLARALFSTGHVTDAFDMLEAELAALEGADAQAVMRLEAELASIGLLHPPSFRGAEARFAGVADLAGDTPAELLLISNASAWSWLHGSAEEAAELAIRSLGGGRLHSSEGADSIAVLQSAWVLMFADRHDEAGAVLDATLADARSRGSVFGFTASCTMRALGAWRRGDVTAAEAEARSGLAMAEPPPFSRPTLFTYLALALIERGELDEAEWAVTESGCGPWLPELVQMSPAFYARGRLRLAQARPEEALADFLELGRRDETMGVRNPGVPWRLGAAEAELLLGHDDEARRLADAHAEHAERWGTASALGVSAHGRGLAAGAGGIDLLAHAVDVLSAAPARLDHARALVNLGSAIRRAGRRAEARDPLREGLDAARRCGATSLALRAHSELVTAGARPRRLMFSGVESLTASERRVAEMAAGGQSNREIAQALFVTVKTVENHLSNTYRKLGIGSRRELVEELAGPTPSPVTRPPCGEPEAATGAGGR